MCHLRHMLIIFLFRRKVKFYSQDIQVFVFLAIPWFTKFVTSWWVLVHETRCIFEYLFNHNSLTHQTWPIGGCKQGQQLSGILWAISMTGAKFQVLFNLTTSSNYSITNYVKIPVFFRVFLLKRWIRDT